MPGGDGTGRCPALLMSLNGGDGMNAVVKAVETLTVSIGFVLGWALFVMGFLITYEVIMRYVFISPTTWVSEITQQIQIWLVFMGAAVVLKSRDMITIELILNDRTTIWRKLSETFALVMLYVVTVPAIWFGIELWLRSTRLGHTTDSTLGLPRWFTDAPVWLGFSLLSLQALAELWKIWTIGVPANSFDPTEGAH